MSAIRPPGKRRGPEVLAPAGAPECLPAAVAGGADAVFLGLRHFNARGRAENFRKADLPAHVRYLHDHGLKCYVVLNTLVHDDELPKAVDLAAAAVNAEVDAAIIQDLGLWRVLAQALPQLKRHASTQMTIHDPSQVEVLAGLGAERVILARELAQPEVAACSRRAAELGIETEHFVHGALCYAFSGQCLMSNFAGCRSANRGTCAQNCRFRYDDGEREDTRLSMKDFKLLAHVGELADAGVASLKIEGRLKGPDYVYAVSRAYRAAVDAWAERQPFSTQREHHDRLRTVFARPFTATPWLGDYSENARIHRDDPDADVAPDGTLLTLDRSAGTALIAAATIAPGQGYRFAIGMYHDGLLVIAADRSHNGHWRCKVRVSAHGPRPPARAALFRNSDQARDQEVRQAMAEVPLPTTATGIRIDVAVSARSGQPLTVSARTGDGRTATVMSAIPAVAATARALDDEQLRSSLGAFGGSDFRLDQLDCTGLDHGLFMPAAQLKILRRELIAALALQPPVAQPSVQWQLPEVVAARRRTTQLWVVVSALAAVDVAFAAGAEAVWLDDPTLDLWSAQPPTIAKRVGLWLRHPVTAPLSPHLKAIGLPVVSGHLGAITAACAAGLAITADTSANAYSTQTIAALNALGASAVVMSLECSAREIARVAGRLRNSDSGLAVVIHGRVPAMLTRQDHGLASGATTRIQAHDDEGGLPYVLQRRQHDTVVWEARTLAAPECAVATLGVVDAWVLELGGCSDADVIAMVTAYAALRAGTLSAQELAEQIAASNRDGVFSGHLHIGARELDGLVEDSEDQLTAAAATAEAQRLPACPET